MVATCKRPCIAVGDLEFLFGGLFQVYDAGVVPIYLGQFETFVLKHDVCPVDRIAQYLTGYIRPMGCLIVLNGSSGILTQPVSTLTR